MDGPTDPPDPLADACEDCGEPIPHPGWCRSCARAIAREMSRDR